LDKIFTSQKLPIVAEVRLKKAADQVIKWINENGFRISTEETESENEDPGFEPGLTT
jgi:hypothetical protein